ncbi:Hypothetical protein GLP15_2959 [Giardia lamblia P15]|uniref:UBX domain-containing protein n=1 Tax=Giardia intestinalis (strain P15) TaxID=658858 RepID=E1EYU7_GIAIA|nr:Hypothetical protein GLP15_2959 [Giardia lamblia P15]
MSEELITTIHETYGFPLELVRDAVASAGDDVDSILDYIAAQQPTEMGDEIQKEPVSEDPKLSGSTLAPGLAQNRAPTHSPGTQPSSPEELRIRRQKAELEEIKREKQREKNMKAQLHDRIRYEMEARKHESEELRKRMQQQYTEMRAAMKPDGLLGSSEDVFPEHADSTAACSGSACCARNTSDLQTVTVVEGVIKVKAIRTSGGAPKQVSIRIDETMEALFDSLELLETEGLWYPAASVLYSRTSLNGKTLKELGFVSNTLFHIRPSPSSS